MQVFGKKRKVKSTLAAKAEFPPHRDWHSIKVEFTGLYPTENTNSCLVKFFIFRLGSQAFFAIGLSGFSTSLLVRKTKSFAAGHS